MDFNTCINRGNVDEGRVFKTYDQFERAVEKAAAAAAAGGSGSGNNIFLSSKSKKGTVHDGNGMVVAAGKSGKSAKSAKVMAKGGKRNLRQTAE